MDLVAPDVGHQIADGLFGHTHIHMNQIKQHLVQHAIISQFADWQAQPFVVDFSAVGRYALASDIRKVGDAHRKSNQPVCAKHRAHDVNIKQVASTHPGIVGDDDIARPHGLGRKSPQHMAHGGRGGAGE